jgi:tRNA threonylcarbamoyl adenosine modification protein YeaZ
VLLAIDTSVGTSVAVVDADRGILAERDSEDSRRHAELVGAFLRECLDEAGVAPAELSGVVAGMGPGPFTGLRVGIAAARVFALGAGIPLVPLVSHDALAFGATRPLLVVTDARRRELYWSEYGPADADGLPVRMTGPVLSKPDGVPSHPDRLDASRIPASSLGLLAESLWAHGRSFGPAEPLYLRSPDVTLSAGPKRVTG